jgi:uncharacterized DUF497 family protein
MGRDEKCSWDDNKQVLNIARHGYDFADLLEIFDGRFLLTRRDDRFAYGELRYNTLAELRGRIVNVTFTPRAGKVHLISVRRANRKERKVYHAKHQDKF